MTPAVPTSDADLVRRLELSIAIAKGKRMAIEHTRKEIEDDGCLDFDGVKTYTSVLAALENAIDELSDAERKLTKDQYDMFGIDGDVRALKARYEQIKWAACWCGKPLDKHAEEPQYADAAEYRREQLLHRYGL